ncbi:HET-domain-containing protein [Xylaria curta]|nr:HET-domain-containing protein [Xylaria curta]
MRLLDTTTLKLRTFKDDEKPRYAILSHTWGDDEVLFEDIQYKSIEQWMNKAGSYKVIKSAQICAKHGIAYIWIDACCIDKGSSSELSEAINSMFKWYQNSYVCYVYLSDVLSNDIEDPQTGIVSFKKSRWFTRGWTLQELIAPTIVQFFDKAWSHIGERDRLAEDIHHVTGIDKDVLSYKNWDINAVKNYSVHTKMVWANGRTTTRSEDRAYSLMGLFNVNMPLLYGEGEIKAFMRLQNEIVRSTNDQSILLHSDSTFHSHLANSPDYFEPIHRFIKRGSSDLAFQINRDSIDVSLGLCPAKGDPDSCWGVIAAYFGDDPVRLDQPVIRLSLYSDSDLLYRRKEKMIYRIRHGDRGQMEVLDEIGKRIEVLQHDLLRRKVVRLGSYSDLLRRATSQEALIRVLLQPIVHKYVSSRYEYHISYPQAHGVVISSKPYVAMSWERARRVLVAYVLLQNVGPNLGSPNVAIFIFKHRGIYTHLIDIRSWLGENGAGIHMQTLESVAAHLSSLPVVTTKYKSPDDKEVRHVIEDLEREYDQNAGASTVLSSGVRVTAWISKQMFFEDIVYHLHVEVDQQKAIPL